MKIIGETCVEGRSVDIQYSNWASGHPLSDGSSCVISTRGNLWNSLNCSSRQMVACQS